MEALRRQAATFNGPDYEVYALKYGEHAGYPSFLYHWLGVPPLSLPQSYMTVGFYYWLIKGPDKTYLVDAGCSADMGQTHGMSTYEDHATMLGRMDLTPDDIDALIITHLDYDHFEGITVFESGQAPVYLHEAALDWHVSKALRYPIFRLTGMPSIQEVDTALRFMQADRFRLITCGHGQIAEIDAGLAVIRVDGHYDGLLSVVVKTAKGLVVLAGDSNYLYSNLEMKWPGGLIRTALSDALDVFPILDLFNELGATIVPGHDVAIMDNFPQVAAGVVQIA